MIQNMKFSLSILILFAIVLIAIFGSFSMIGMEHENCWVATTNGVACSESINPLTYINFHLKVLSGFSLVVFQNILLLIFLLAISLLIISKTLISKQISAWNNFRSSFRLANILSKLIYNKFVYWLSLLENSPSTSLKA